MMQRLKKIFFVCLAAFVVFVGGFALWLSRQYVTPIILYHHVAENPKGRMDTVSPETFARQTAYLEEHGYRVLTLEELTQMIRAQKPLPGNGVVITFDDGYDDNYTNAFPVLQKHGFPAAIFVTADMVNTQGFLTWPQLREMDAQGITIGSHTRRHAYLPDLAEKQQREEIESSRQILEQGLGKAIEYLAYPSGGFSEPIKKSVKEAGYKAACTTNRGYDRLNRDVYELKRIRFSDKDTSDLVLWAKLSGYYNVFRSDKEPY